MISEYGDPLRFIKQVVELIFACQFEVTNFGYMHHMCYI